MQIKHYINSRCCRNISGIVKNRFCFKRHLLTATIYFSLEQLENDAAVVRKL